MRSLSRWQRWSGGAAIVAPLAGLVGLGVGPRLGGAQGLLVYGAALVYVASACTWTIASVRDPGVMARRLLCIWLSAALPVALCVYVAKAYVDEEQAFLFLLLVPPTALILLTCFISTAVAFIAGT